MISFTVMYNEETKQSSVMGNCTPQQAMQLIMNNIVSSAVAKAEAKARSNNENKTNTQNNNQQSRLPL